MTYDPQQASSDPQKRFPLRLMQTTDLHAHIYPFDYLQDLPNENRGLVALADEIDRARGSVAPALLFDCGDFLSGSPFGDVPSETGTHPVMDAMNLMNYDAVALGNHEFNSGLSHLRAALSKARFPVLCANIRYKDAPLTDPFHIIRRRLKNAAGVDQEIRIGVIACAPQSTVMRDRMVLPPDMTATDPVEAVANLLPELEHRTDLIVVLCHGGIGDPDRDPDNMAMRLAHLDGVDVILTAHQHRLFPGPGFDHLPGVDATCGRLCGKPAVMAGAYGTHLGLVDLSLEHDKDGWRIADARITLRAPFAQGTMGRSALRMSEALGRHHATVRNRMNRIVGHSAIDLNSAFAWIGHDTATALTAQMQARAVKKALQNTQWAELPLVSAASPFKPDRGAAGAGVDIPAGPVRMRHLMDIYPFPNTLCAMKMTGSQIQAWLESASRIFNQISPGSADAPLIDTSVPGYNFDTLFGLTYDIDLSVPAGAGRIRNIRHSGHNVSPDQHLVVATNSCRLSDSTHFRSISPEETLYKSDQTCLETLTDYVSGLSVLDQVFPAGWRFAPIAGATAIFALSATAARHFRGIDAAAIENAGHAPEGHHLIRLHFDGPPLHPICDRTK